MRLKRLMTSFVAGSRTGGYGHWGAFYLKYTISALLLVYIVLFVLVTGSFL